MNKHVLRKRLKSSASGVPPSPPTGLAAGLSRGGRPLHLWSKAHAAQARSKGLIAVRIGLIGDPVIAPSAASNPAVMAEPPVVHPKAHVSSPERADMRQTACPRHPAPKPAAQMALSEPATQMA